jgi:hypothetical protein
MRIVERRIETGDGIMEEAPPLTALKDIAPNCVAVAKLWHPS